jgi:cytochrome c oxidase subunit IV
MAHEHVHHSGEVAAHAHGGDHGEAHGGAHGDDVGHIVSPKILFATGGALLVLTVITVAAAKLDFEQFDLRELNIFVALAIAVVKASLVCLFFMHLRWDRPFNAFVLVASLALVALFIWFAMTDSSEYQHEIVQGDSETIKSKLTAIPQESGAGAPATPTTAGH